MDLRQVVCPHQPDEAGLGRADLQACDGVDRETGAKVSFQSGDNDAGMVGELVRAPQALLERRHVIKRFERVLGCDEPPDLVKEQPLQCQTADKQVALMGWIERAAQQPDTAAGSVVQERKVACQGLICPLPRTTYFMVVN